MTLGRMSSFIYRFSFVIAFTALGQILSVLFYPVMSNYTSVDSLSEIAIIDSSILFLMSILGFGINVTTTRDVAVSESHDAIVRKTQEARFMFASVITLLSVILFYFDAITNQLFYTSLCSIIIALNYDYVLYGLGKPQNAAIASFVRLSLPLAVCLLAAYVGFSIGSIEYLAVMMLFLIFSSFLVSYFCKTSLLYKPDIHFYKVYIAAGWVGVAGVFLSFHRFGFVTFLNSEFSSSEIVALTTVLKFGLFAIAAKRILIQFFYKQLLNEKIYNVINYSLTALGILVVLVMYFMAETVSEVFHGVNVTPELAFLMSIYVSSMLIFPLSGAKLLLLKKDKVVFLTNVLFSSMFVIVLLTFNTWVDTAYTAVALLIAVEFCISVAQYLYIFNRRSV